MGNQSWEEAAFQEPYFFQLMRTQITTTAKARPMTNKAALDNSAMWARLLADE
jgi:hypothetical protein